MIRALYTAASGMAAQQANIDTVAHNLANVNTTGFKKSRMEFEDLVYQVTRTAGTPTSTSTEAPIGLETGLGTKPVATARDFTTGNLKSTNGPLDLAIEGRGFFQIALPDGTTICPAGPPICGIQGPGSPLDAQLPKTPKWKATFNPEYDILLPNQASIRIIPAFTYTSQMFNDSLNTPQLRRPASRMLDASIHYAGPDQQYDFAIGGTNLTNDRFVTAGSPNYGAGEISGYYNPPRMWYASVRVKFQP